MYELLQGGIMYVQIIDLLKTSLYELTVYILKSIRQFKFIYII